MPSIETITASFKSYFNANPQFIARAPGRVNLIGEHTDYNDGFVLPMAIDRAVWIALTPRNDSKVNIFPLDINPHLSPPKPDSVFDLHSLTPGKGWLEYPKGIAYQLIKDGLNLKGFNAVMTGDVPRGAGLSSSAAVELAVARAFCAASNIEWNPTQMAKAAQQAENDWVGVKCGIMDQMASAACKEGHALFLDCRSLEVQHAPMPKNAAIAIMDTSTRRGLVDSAYNERRSQCEEAAKWFGVDSLRDLSIDSLNKNHNGLSDVVYKRARHVVTENERVLRSIEAMKSGDIKTLGELFNQSHDSLRDDYEVTNDALNFIVDSARETPGCYGARMTGAGFGGCAVALIEADKASAFENAVKEKYNQRSGKDAAIFICKASAGAELVS